MQKQEQFLLQFSHKAELPYVNRNNLHSYSPYFYNEDSDSYQIDQAWYDSLTQEVKADLQNKFKIGQLKTFSFPHQVKKQPQYWEIYTWYNCWVYDFGRYVGDINSINGQNICLVKFLDNKQRAQFSQLFFKQNPKIQTMERLNKEIQPLFQNQKEGYFVKLTQRSAKNSIKLFPAKNLLDVYKNLIYSPDVKKEIYESSGIILRQWKEFSQALEFRVHVYKKRIICLSLQYYEKKVDYKKINLGLLIQLLNESIKKVNFANSFVIDVIFINNQKIWLLQFNPYGVYAASRSALFTHQQIMELQQSQKPPIAKFLP